MIIFKCGFCNYRARWDRGTEPYLFFCHHCGKRIIADGELQPKMRVLKSIPPELSENLIKGKMPDINRCAPEKNIAQDSTGNCFAKIAR